MFNRLGAHNCLMRDSITIKKKRRPFPFGRKQWLRHAKSLHKILHLFLLILPRKQGYPCKQLCQNTPRRPYINLKPILNAHSNLRRPVIPRLYIRIPSLILETTRPQIYNLNPGLIKLPQENVFWFEVAVDDVLLS